MIIVTSDIEQLPDECFEYLKSLERVQFEEPSHIKYIGKWCFWGCFNLKEFIIPDSCEVINDDSFKHCGIKKLYIGRNTVDFDPSSLTEIESVIIDDNNPHEYDMDITL